VEVAIIAAVIGVVVLVAWPFVARRSTPKAPQAQDEVTDTHVVPPKHPDEPVPGSRTYRERQGRP
jgi:hypothetical protein